MFFKPFDRRGATLAADMAFVPAVMFMRLPLMAAEARESVFPGIETALAFSEKAEAIAEGVFAAQVELFGSAMRFWPELLAGGDPARMMHRAVCRAGHAALKPAGRRVRANYRRLSRG